MELDKKIEAFLWALKVGDLDKIKEILNKENPTFLSSKVLHQEPLVVAADYGHSTLLDHLISKYDLNVNVRDENNISPMDAAISEDHVECVKILLKHNAKKVNHNNEYYTKFTQNAA
ncbi:hypothetical protein A3Q56_05250, partial [Intoshia linei]